MQCQKSAWVGGLRGAEQLLAAHGKRKILAHGRDVARKAREIGEGFGLDGDVLFLAGLCHDVGGVMTPDEMRKGAASRGIVLDPAEDAYPFLLHQRFSRILCEEALDIRDERVLCAVECHTTLWSRPSAYDMALYLADKLAWDQPGEPPYGAAVQAALEVSLEAACLAQIDYLFAKDMILYPHRWLLEARCWLASFEKGN